AAGQPLAGVEVAAAATPTGPPRRPFGAFRGPRPGQPGGRRPRTASGADGAFRLRGLDPTETWTLEARAAGFAPAKAEAGPLAPRRTRGGVVLALQRGGAIVGRFVDAQEKPLDAVVVEIAAAPTMARGPMPFGPPADRTVSWRALSDRQGEFRVADLPAGRFELTTQRRGFAPERRGGLAVEAGATLDLGAIALGQGAAVEGRVAAADGTPIAGAEIRAAPSEMGRGMMRRRGAPETEPDAVSDALGAFVLPDQKPGAVLTLSVHRDGYADLDVPGVAVPPNAPLTITLVPASRVEGAVVDADKKPIAGARVAAAVQQGGGGPRGFGPRRALEATADEDGRFVFDDVPAGIATLTASAPGRKDGKLEGVRVVAGKNVTGLSIALDAGAWLVGRVLLADGTAAIGAAVAQVGAQSAAMGGPGGGASAATTSSAIADGDGLYRLDGLGAGGIDVEATLEGSQRAVKHVELRTGENQLDLQLSGGQTVSGSVVDDGGAPVPLAVVSLSGTTPFGGRGATADDQGLFALSGLSDGDYALVARRDGYTTSDATAVKVQGAPVQGVEIKLPRGGAIVGAITGLSADKLSGVTVVAMQQGLGGGGASASPDASGAFRIDNCRYGDWTVVARREEGASATTHVTVSAATPEPRADLSFGDGATLSGTVVDGAQPLAGATVFARALGAAAGGAPGLESGTATTGADGRFKIEGLAAGSYNVSVLRMADGLDFSTQVDVSADRDVTLRAPRTTVGGRVLDSADRSALAGATAELTPSAAMGGRGGGLLRATTGDDGRFTIANVAEGTWTLAVRLDGYAAARQNVSVAESGAPDSEVLLQRTSGLALRVTLAAGSAPDAVEALLLDEAGRVVAGGRYDTGEGGLVTIGDAPQGTYALVIQADGAAAVTTSATAPGGPLAILLPAPCHLDVEVADLAGKDTAATLSIYDANGTAWRRPMMRNAPASFPMVLGRASLDGLPPGTWTVVATTTAGGRWQGTATTTASAAAKLEL
ncbi:MAG: carboxypeptidase-like regulatory domain-containing protein, partial [Candidatus Polarisedimenticolia bacterium]